MAKVTTKSRPDKIDSIIMANIKYAATVEWIKPSRLFVLNFCQYLKVISLFRD